MKYKVGDKVKVREDLKPNEYYDGIRFDGNMQKMKGKTVTIEKVFPDKSYWIEEYGFIWSDEMLEDVEEENTISEEMTIGQVIDNLMNNPDIIIKKLTQLAEECQKVNEDLKTKLKSKQAEIDFLKGQLSVYEKFLKETEEK